MALVNKIQPSQSVPPTRHPGKLKRVGSLVELFDFFVLNEGKVIDTVSVNTFLYTYRLFADMELVLEVVNKKQILGYMSFKPNTYLLESWDYFVFPVFSWGMVAAASCQRFRLATENYPS